MEDTYIWELSIIMDFQNATGQLCPSAISEQPKRTQAAKAKERRSMRHLLQRQLSNIVVILQLIW